jgi:hypothetical protein
MQIPDKPDNEGKNLSSDLRSYYAQLLGAYLFSLQDDKISGRPQQYFTCLNNILALTQHKLKAPEEINKILSEVTKLAYEHLGAWTGEVIRCDEADKMFCLLRKAETLLLAQMSEAGLFGEVKEKELPI